MSNEEKAKDFLEKFFESRPKEFLEKLNDNSKGLFIILRLLDQSTNEILAGDISNQLDFTTPRVAAALKNLEKKGYIRRCDSAQDARKTVVMITEEGRAALKERECELIKFVERLIDAVGEEDLNEFLRIAIKMQKAIEGL